MTKIRIWFVKSKFIKKIKSTFYFTNLIYSLAFMSPIYIDRRRKANFKINDDHTKNIESKKIV